MKNFYYTLELNLVHPTIKAAFEPIAKQLGNTTFLQTRSRPFMTINDALESLQQEALERVTTIREKNEDVTLEQVKTLNPLHFAEEMLYDAGEEGPTVESLEMGEDELEFWQDNMLTSYTFTDPANYGFAMRYILQYFDDPISERLIGDPTSFFIQQNLSSTVH